MARIFEGLALPVAVWDAIDGYPAELIARLRGEDPLTRMERDAIADFFEGKRAPRKRRGRPPDQSREAVILAYGGHDPRTKVGRAALHYLTVHYYIRHQKGWHLKTAGKWYRSSDWLLQKIAERYRVNEDKLRNHLRRSRPRPKPARFGVDELWLDHREWRERIGNLRKKTRAKKQR